MMVLLGLMYFEQYRGVATGIKLMGGQLGSLFFPQVALLLEDHYGYRGSLLILGGVTMHITAFSILLKEPSWACKPNSEASSKVSATDCPGPNATAPKSNTETEVGAKREVFLHVVDMLQNPLFYALLASYVMFDYTVVMYLPSLVDFGLDRGFSTNQAQSVITYSSVGELSGVVLPPLLSDQKYLGRNALYMVAFLMLGIGMIAHPLVESYAAFVFLSTLVRGSLGCLTTMKAVVVGDYFGVERLTAFWSIAGLASLPSLLFSPSVIGTCDCWRVNVYPSYNCTYQGIC